MLTSMLFGDEVQRVDDMIGDITKLRKSYEQCKQKLKSIKNSETIVECKKEKEKLEEYKLLVDQERAKTSDLMKKLVSCENNKKSLDVKIVELEKKIEIEKKLLKVKDNIIISLESKCKEKKVKKVKTKEKTIFTLENICKKTIYEDANPFPKLMMKKKYRDEQKEIQKVSIFKASAFRLKNDADIYAYPNKKIIDKWEKNRSFTSNKETLNWFGITGFFVDKKWKRARRSMWIKKIDTIKR
jgi:hypothetical protein